MVSSTPSWAAAEKHLGRTRENTVKLDLSVDLCSWLYFTSRALKRGAEKGLFEPRAAGQQDQSTAERWTGHTRRGRGLQPGCPLGPWQSAAGKGSGTMHGASTPLGFVGLLTRADVLVTPTHSRILSLRNCARTEIQQQQ